MPEEATAEALNENSEFKRVLMVAISSASTIDEPARVFITSIAN